KLGTGVLALGGQGDATNDIAVNISNGVLVLTSTASYSRMSVNVASGTTLDMRGQSNIALGTVTGSGTIRNFHPTAGGTLTLGLDNKDGTFDGQFESDYTTGLLNITKDGTGKWTLTADNSNQLIGNLVINSGSVVLNGTSAKIGFASEFIDEGGALTLDNSTN